MQKKWIERDKLNIEKMQEIARTCNVSPAIAAIIQKRNIANPKEYIKKENILFSPYLISDMHAGITTVYDEITQSDSLMIGIINDYDVDGITSGVILKKGLELCSSKVSVKIYTPNRDIDGYGMSKRLVDNAYADGCKLLITCDNGVTALTEIEYANTLGLTVVVTDHHEPIVETINDVKVQKLPKAPVVNPKRMDSTTPQRDICGAMVAYKFIYALLDKMEASNEDKRIFQWFGSELAALGTICDVMPLLSENRAITYFGLECAKSSSFIGLRQLYKVMNIEPSELSTSHIGFNIGPCLNACSRMTGSADEAVALLLEKDHTKAFALAKKIVEYNVARKDIQAKGEQIALEYVRNHPNEDFYLIYTPDISSHILGIIAGKIKEITNRPCICVSDIDEDTLKGSGRSVDTFDMYGILSEFRDLYSSFGGHEMAVGISFKKQNFDLIRNAINNYIKDNNIDLNKDIEVIYDLTIPMTNVTVNMCQEMKLLEPFGTANNYPLFKQENALIKKITRIGQRKNYIKLELVVEGKTVYANYFGNADKFDKYIEEKTNKNTLEALYNGTKGIIMQFLYESSINVWNGNVSVQHNIKEYAII